MAGPSAGRAAVHRIARSPAGFLLALPTRGLAAMREFQPDVIEFEGPLGPLLLAMPALLGAQTPPSLGLIRGLVDREVQAVRTRVAAGGVRLRPVGK